MADAGEPSGAGRTRTGDLLGRRAGDRRGRRSVDSFSTLKDPEHSSAEAWGAGARARARTGLEPEGGADAAASDWMLGFTRPSPGERVLDVACGAGRVGLRAAGLVGREGFVVCSDLSEDMVAATRETAERLGRSNVEAVVLDAMSPSWAEEPFDVILCRFGLMHMSDPAAALRHARAALAPGGRLAVTVWSEGSENPWLMAILAAVMDHFGAPPPSPGVPGPFALGGAGELRGLIEASGFAHAVEERIEAEAVFDSVDAWWDHILEVSGPLATLLESTEAADRSEIRERAREAVAAHVGPDRRVVFPAVAIGGGGVVRLREQGGPRP